MSKKHTILIIDDVKFNIQAAKDVLGDKYNVVGAGSAEEGYEVLSHLLPDLILLDIMMPKIDGHEVLRVLKSTPRLKNIPVIFLTADANPETEVEGFNEGIVDFVTKPFIPAVMEKRIQTQIELAEYERSLETKVKEKVAETEAMYDLLSVSFAALAECRDGITGGHLKNTAIYFRAFINHLAKSEAYRDQLNPAIVEKASRSAPLHDIGKIAIRDNVLQKPASLTKDEYDRMKLHAVIGGEVFDFIGKRIPDKEFAQIAHDVCCHHHEKWDGTGYPDGLAGTDIPFVARIMSIVDVYDALTSERPYKKPFSHEKSMAIIAESSGKDFDPGLVKEFLNISDAIKECLKTKEEDYVSRKYFRVPDHLLDKTIGKPKE